MTSVKEVIAHVDDIGEEMRRVWPTREEIVRCRGCRHFKLDQSDHEHREPYWCKRWNTDRAKPDGFCAWAERRKS